MACCGNKRRELSGRRLPATSLLGAVGTRGVAGQQTKPSLTGGTLRGQPDGAFVAGSPVSERERR